MPLQLTKLGPEATAADVKAVTDRDGGVIVAGVLDPLLLQRLNAELGPHLTAEDPSFGYAVDDEERASFYGRRTKRLQSLVMRSDSIVEALADARLIEWVERCLEWCTEVQLSSAQLIEIGPGQPAQVLHTDEELWPEAMAAAPGEFTVSCMLALTEFTYEMGATRIVPGSNGRRDDPRSFTHDDTVPAVMDAGDALFFTGSVVHGGGANQTADRWRRGIALSYLVGWMRPEEAHNLAVSVERARELPPRVRELLSFAGYRAKMGVVYQLDMQDPYPVLFGEARPTRPLAEVR